MIVVATDDFEVYHGVVNELRDRGISFTTVQPGEDLPERATVVITGRREEAAESTEQVVADATEPREAVEEALGRLRGGAGRTIVGVDPGTKPGVAVLRGGEVVAAFQVPLTEAAEAIHREIEDDPEAVVRIGDGARLRGSQLINDLEDVRIELVDETGTTPHLGTGARGMGDVLAAVNIAHREGEAIENRTIEPTGGEIQTIKTASRERSPENRAITGDLARRVAAGELTIEEALKRHQDE